MQVIKCPHCKKEFEISDALNREFREKLAEELEAKHKIELEKQKKELEEKTAKKVREELGLKLRDQENEAKEAKERGKRLEEELLNMNKLIRELKQKDEDRKLEMEKKLLEEEELIKKKAIDEATKESHTKLLEKDKQIQDAMKEIEDMKRKLQQGSQQTQGEVFELEFEKLLSVNYPNDKILPVGKGIKGGDVIQEVWDSRGIYVGKILWELKNTKTWSEGWIDKLKNDKRTINAEEAVLVSNILPNDVDVPAKFRNQVWITKQSFVIPLADTLRAKLIQLHYVRNSVKNKDEKMEILYKYLSGTEFVHRVEAIVDAFTNMQDEVEKEKRYFANKWARDEKNIRQVIDNTYGMHGDLRGVIGDSLPKIKGLVELEDGKEK